VAPLYIKQLIKMKLTDMFRISCCGTMPKIMQIGAGFLKKWAFKCSGFDCFCQWNTKLLNLSPPRRWCTTYFTNLLNIDWTDVVRTTQCLSMPKITQTGSGILKM